MELSTLQTVLLSALIVVVLILPLTLHKVEENFAGKSYAAEAALLRAVFADRAGKSPEALQILNGLHENTDKFLAAESLLRTGEPRISTAEKPSPLS